MDYNDNDVAVVVVVVDVDDDDDAAVFINLSGMKSTEIQSTNDSMFRTTVPMNRLIAQ